MVLLLNIHAHRFLLCSSTARFLLPACYSNYDLILPMSSDQSRHAASVAYIQQKNKQIERQRGEQAAALLFNHPDTSDHTRRSQNLPQAGRAGSEAYLKGFDNRWQEIHRAFVNREAVLGSSRQRQAQAEEKQFQTLEAGKRDAYTLFWSPSTTDGTRLDPKMPKQATTGTGVYNAGFQSVWNEEGLKYRQLYRGK